MNNLLRAVYYVAWLLAFSCLVCFNFSELFKDPNKRHPVVVCKLCSKSETVNTNVLAQKNIIYFLQNSYIFQSLRVIIRLKCIKVGGEHLKFVFL